MKKDRKNVLRVSRETIRKLDAPQLCNVAGAQFVWTNQLLPTVCLACQN